MNEVVKQDAGAADETEMFIDKRVNKVIQVLKRFGYYEVPTEVVGSKPIQSIKDDGNQ